jgi:type I restriction enzyme S subunit
MRKIPSHWEMRRLKYAALESGSKLDRKPDNQSYLGLENIESGTGKVLLEDGRDEVESTVIDFQEGDILFGKLRPYLAKVVHADFDGVGTTELLVLRPKSDVDGHFLFYHLLADGFIDKVNSLTYGAKMPRANSTQVGNLLVGLPPQAEQRAIAAFLDRETARIDALIRKQERLIDLLEEKRAALISHTVTKGLDPNVEMKETGVEWLGKIPAHWEVRRLKFLVTEMRAGPFGSSLTKSMYTSEGYRVYGQEQVIPADFSIGDYYVSPEKYASMQQYAVSPGDVLVSCVGTFGKTAVVPEDIEPGIINPRLIKLTLVRGLIAPEYLRLFLESSIAFGQMEQVSRGGTMDVINIALLSHLWVPFPTLHEQRATLDFLGEKTTKIDALIDKTEAMIERLQEYRTALISAAVTGKIDVRGEV